MSPAVTSPLPLLRRYMTTGSSYSLVSTMPFDVQQNLSDVFHDTRQSGELMQGTGNTHGSDRRARNRAQQCAAQRITKRVSETGLKRLDDETGTLRIDGFLGKCRTLCDKHCVYPFSFWTVVHSPSVSGFGWMRLLSAQTRRRFGGRTPLCACGVTSVMEPTLRVQRTGENGWRSHDRNPPASQRHRPS